MPDGTSHAACRYCDFDVTTNHDDIGDWGSNHEDVKSHIVDLL